jgi:hypothetical protein
VEGWQNEEENPAVVPFTGREVEAAFRRFMPEFGRNGILG